MTDSQNNQTKPKRMYFKSYLNIIRNSVGSNLFRNFYVSTPEKGEFDALNDGENSCAFFVSSILTSFNKISGIHGTVASTIDDLQKSGWLEVDTPEPGDVLVWKAQKFDDGWKEHIGFYIGEGKAVSNSWIRKTPVEHDQNFGKSNRKIIKIFRTKWEANFAKET